MNQSEKKMTPAPPEGNVLSIPNIMLEAAGIPKDSDLTVEPFKTVTHPMLGLLEDLGIPFEDVRQALEEGGYLDK